ncbi:MAG: succinate dehydrogenase [Planctomycetota bacterium]|nr:MAG: succinate dehydrogenase [Planctomycetota bacterium]REK38096.1 MAG: succinate dehydrogenase [Planctomycetota bacterium]
MTAALRSSVGKKFVMGITGLFLCGFLVIHLAGNLLLYIGDGTVYNEYAHKLHSNPILLFVAEVILFAGFLIHIYLAIVTNRENRAARGVRYAVKKTKREDRTVNLFGWTPDTTMFASGAVILGFLVVHLSDFKFGDIVHGERIAGLEPADKARILMSDAIRAGIYLVGSIFVGIHVSHGFWSAFQSLGVNHPKYNDWIRKVGIAFAIIVAVGFGSFFVWGISGGEVDPAVEEAPVGSSSVLETAPPRPDQYTQK